MKLTKNEFLNQYAVVSDRDNQLLSAAYDILHANILKDPSLPWGDMAVITPWNNDRGGIWGWDSGFHAMSVSRYDTELAKSCIEAYIQFQLPNGMFPDVIRVYGTIAQYHSKPPVLPWTTMIVYDRDNDKEFLRKCYNHYVRNEEFLKKERFYDGLFYYSSQEDDVSTNDYQRARWESGWDNSSRWDVTPIINLWPIDLNCYMVQFYRAMARMAKILGEDQSIVLHWQKNSERIAQLIEERLFDSENGYYTDVNRFTGTYSPVLSPASFMPLYIGIASNERAQSMAKLAADKNKFYPGMPTVSYDHPTYGEAYWRGYTWLNVAYFALKGLKNYDHDHLADEMRNYLLDMIYDNLDQGIFENYDSLKREGRHFNTFSWSACFIMEFILNW